MITVTVGEQKTQTFPKIMKYTAGKDFVYFISDGKGINLLTGEYRTDWITSSFADYNLPITLQNILP